MNVSRYVLIIVLAVAGVTAHADELEKCLNSIRPSTHRLERDEAVGKCFGELASSTGKDACFGHIEKYKSLVNSTRLRSQAISSCFYESNSYRKIQDCVEDTKLFKIATEHDDALFFCYKSFEEVINKNECLSTAKKMIFPSKRDYLSNHCQEN